MAVNRLAHLALSEKGFLFDSSTGYTYSLNQTGAFILRMLMEGLSRKEIADRMFEEYDASRETIIKDLEQFLRFVSHLGIIEEKDG